MCNLSDWAEERGIAKGEARGIAKGEARGIAKGEARGEQKTIYRLVSSGKLTKERGAEEIGVTVDRLIDEMKRKGYPLPV